MQNSTLAPGKVIVSAMLDEAQRDHLLRIARAADRSLSAEVSVGGRLDR
jgi:hypothetical protein